MGEMIPIDELPEFLKQPYDLDTLYCDLLHLRGLAHFNASAFAQLQGASELEKKACDRMAAAIYLQIDLLDAAMWKVERLNDSHRLVAKRGSEKFSPVTTC